MLFCTTQNNIPLISGVGWRNHLTAHGLSVYQWSLYCLSVLVSISTLSASSGFRNVVPSDTAIRIIIFNWFLEKTVSSIDYAFGSTSECRASFK